MRDIRLDLKERLSGLAQRRSQAEQRFNTELEEIASEESVLVRLLQLEEDRVKGPAPSNGGVKPTLLPGAANVVESGILSALADGRVWTHSEIKAYLVDRGLGPDEPAFGRSVQGVLLSMRARDLVEKTGTALWRKSEEAR